MGDKAAIHYTVDMLRPEAHLFTVTLTIAKPDADGQVLSLPAWIPGSYMIRDFAKNIVTLQAECNGESIATQKHDKQTWQCAPCDGPLVITYEVYCWDLSVRSAHLDTTHGYFNGTSLFLRVHGQDEQRCTVDINAPKRISHDGWRVATTLQSDGARNWGFGRYRADNYDELVDHPVEIGAFELIEYDAQTTPHAMALSGQFHADTERLANDLRRICESQIDLFGEYPDDRYLFLTMVVGDGYGGLEHRRSSSLLCSRDDLPGATMAEPDERYRNFLGLCSHEYFHTWNVKRIKPAKFLPYDLQSESYTRLLWAFEGITSYYDELMLVRSGIISEESYLELLGQTITRVLRAPGRLKQSVADSSFDAWTKFYKQDENAPNAIVSYYAKGAVIALALDLIIRRDTQCKKSLDDVMRALWQEYGKVGRGIGEDELEPFIESVTGCDLKEFFDCALRGTSDIPLAELFATVGIGYHVRPSDGENDKGGKSPSGRIAAPYLGVRLDRNSSSAVLAAVYEDTAAQRCGLSAGDTIVALNNLKVDRSNIERRLAAYQAGDIVRIHLFRRDELMRFDVELTAPPADTCFLSVDEAHGAVLKRRQKWLEG